MAIFNSYVSLPECNSPNLAIWAKWFSVKPQSFSQSPFLYLEAQKASCIPFFWSSAFVFLICYIQNMYIYTHVICIILIYVDVDTYTVYLNLLWKHIYCLLYTIYIIGTYIYLGPSVCDLPITWITRNLRWLCAASADVRCPHTWLKLGWQSMILNNYTCIFPHILQYIYNYIHVYVLYTCKYTCKCLPQL